MKFIAYQIDEINRIEFLDIVHITALGAKTNCPELIAIETIIPKDIIEIWSRMETEIEEWSKLESTTVEELKEFMEALSNSYIRHKIKVEIGWRTDGKNRPV
jgi:hypothetical protein